MCPLGRAGSSPALGTLSAYLSFTRVAKLVDAQSSGGCAFGRAGSSPAPGTKREIAAMRSPVFGSTHLVNKRMSGVRDLKSEAQRMASGIKISPND